MSRYCFVIFFLVFGITLFDVRNSVFASSVNFGLEIGGSLPPVTERSTNPPGGGGGGGTAVGTSAPSLPLSSETDERAQLDQMPISSVDESIGEARNEMDNVIMPAPMNVIIPAAPARARAPIVDSPGVLMPNGAQIGNPFLKSEDSPSDDSLEDSLAPVPSIVSGPESPTVTIQEQRTGFVQKSVSVMILTVKDLLRSLSTNVSYLAQQVVQLGRSVGIFFEWLFS